MSRWFRLYDCLLDDPKVQRLSGDMFKTWVNLLCVASRNDGKLTSVPDLAFALRMSEEAVIKALTVLVADGLIDALDDLKTDLEPHNWSGRQHKSDVSNERVKRHRERQRNGECNVTPAVTVTPPETEADTETEKKETRASALPPDDWPKDAKEQFWAGYPKHVGKQAVFNKLDALRRKGISFVAIMAGVARYKAGEPDPQFIPNPMTWLNQGRWDDEPLTKPNESTVGIPQHGQWVQGRFYAHRESDEFEAWREYELRTKGRPPPTDRHGGWLFPSQFPQQQMQAAS